MLGADRISGLVVDDGAKSKCMINSPISKGMTREVGESDKIAVLWRQGVGGSSFLTPSSVAMNVNAYVGELLQLIAIEPLNLALL